MCMLRVFIAQAGLGPFLHLEGVFGVWSFGLLETCIWNPCLFVFLTFCINMIYVELVESFSLIYYMYIMHQAPRVLRLQNRTCHVLDCADQACMYLCTRVAPFHPLDNPLIFDPSYPIIQTPLILGPTLSCSMCYPLSSLPRQLPSVAWSCDVCSFPKIPCVRQTLQRRTPTFGHLWLCSHHSWILVNTG